jgi:hypothetical protein
MLEDLAELEEQDPEVAPGLFQGGLHDIAY